MRGLAAALLLLAGCGPQQPQLGFDFRIDALHADTIASLQVTLVTKGRSLAAGNCEAVQQTCLVGRAEMTADRYVPVKDANGVEHRALVFPLNLKPSGTDSVQDVSVQGIPLGRDYALVIEAISKGTPLLAGSSCSYLQEITAGTNPRSLPIAIKAVSPPINCDPRVEK